MPVAAAVGIAFLAWTLVDQSDRGGVQAASAACAVAATVLLAWASILARRNAGWAFAATTGAIVALFTTLFVDLYPNAMVSSTSDAFDLTLADAASSNYTLKVMTVVAVGLLPFVLLYQAWTYWVFRHRVGADDVGDLRTPLDLLDARGRGSSGGEPAESR
jgi:cytochrome d ubiquinol oxidase subunit II